MEIAKSLAHLDGGQDGMRWHGLTAPEKARYMATAHQIVTDYLQADERTKL